MTDTTLLHDEPAAAVTTTALADGVRHVTLTGPMTIYEAAALKGRLLAACLGAPSIQLDLSGVDEIDTAGVQLLLLANREVRTGGHRLVLAARSDAVAEVLDRYGLGRFFDGEGTALSARTE